MPHLTWKLDDDRYCDGCPLHEVDGYYAFIHKCKINLYKDKALLNEYDKRRPAKCVKELGE